MWTMATSSMSLFFRGKLFADPAMAYRQLAIGIAVTAIVMIGPASAGAPLWAAALVAGLVGRRAPAIPLPGPALPLRRSMNAVDITPTQRADLAGFLNDVERLETIFATWEETPRGAVEAYRRAIEALHGEAMRRLVRALEDGSSSASPR